MKRYNIFNQVHKGLRALLHETILKLQQTDFTDAEDAEEAVEQVQTVLALFDEHAHTEDSFILSLKSSLRIARFWNISRANEDK